MTPSQDMPMGEKIGQINSIYMTNYSQPSYAVLHLHVRHHMLVQIITIWPLMLAITIAELMKIQQTCAHLYVVL